ncbi:hypothetical protein V8C42DRAFT_283227 [Trichoderma barbatum]
MYSIVREDIACVTALLDPNWHCPDPVRSSRAWLTPSKLITREVCTSISQAIARSTSGVLRTGSNCFGAALLPRGAAESIAAAMWALAAELYQIVGSAKMAQASCHAKRAVPRMERSITK